MVAILGNDAPSYAKMKTVATDFMRVRQSLEDNSCPERPGTYSIRIIVLLYKGSRIETLSARWVQKPLTVDQKHSRWTLSRAFEHFRGLCRFV